MKAVVLLFSLLALVSCTVALKNAKICGDEAFSGSTITPYCRKIEAWTYVVDSNTCVQFDHYCGTSLNVFFTRETCEAYCKE